MSNSKDLLDHMEKVHDDYPDLVDKDDCFELPQISTEDKIIMAHEEPGLEPWEISEIVQGALTDLPENLEDHVPALFDVVYEAISEALDRTRR